MNKLKILLPILLILLVLAAVPAMAEEAEDLTPGLTVKVVDKPGKISCITDGKYTTYWESSKRKDPWVTISSDKPIYGLYLCFRRLPDTYVIQKESGDGWTTVAEGGNPRFHHAYFELDGLKKIRILSTMGTKNTLGFNAIFAFGEGEVPDWVQRWEEPVEKADILILVAHPDDELLFTGGAIPTYGAEKGKKVAVAYLTFSNTTRRSEALNGLWAMGVRNYPVFGPFSDGYVKSGKVKDAYAGVGGKQKVLDWVNELYRRFKPEAVVTHAENGEYGHPQHKMVADAAKECFTLAADAMQSPDSYQAYGTWQVKKLYLHLYGEEAEQTVLDWDQPLAAFGGKTGAQMAAEAFALHVSQDGMGTKIKGKFVVFTVEETGAKLFPYDHFGLQNTTVGQDEAKDDFLEHIINESNLDEEKARDAEGDKKQENDKEAEERTSEEPQEEISTGSEHSAKEIDETEEIPETDPDDRTTDKKEEKSIAGQEYDYAADPEVPEWADVILNERGYLDEGQYILEDEENGHWMYVDRTLRIQIVRSWETPEKVQKKDEKQEFFCYTAEIWCDIASGEFPMNVWSDPGNQGKNPKYIDEIAAENNLIYAVSADYYQYRVGQKHAKKSYHVGIELRDGEIRWDDPNPKPPTFPTYETMALFADGHMETYLSTERSADDYKKAGAIHVYTFGPSLVKDGKISEIVAEGYRALNPRHAFGMVKPGHYIDVICEGRLRSVNGSTGVMMETLAQMMLDRGCKVAVNLDGGETAVCTFMGKKLLLVRDSQTMKLIRGRQQVEALAFGVLNKGD